MYFILLSLQLVNLVANDSQRLFDAVSVTPIVVGGPFIAIAGTIYCIYILGPWALAGSFFLFMFYPYQVHTVRLPACVQFVKHLKFKLLYYHGYFNFLADFAIQTCYKIQKRVHSYYRQKSKFVHRCIN